MWSSASLLGSLEIHGDGRPPPSRCEDEEVEEEDDDADERHRCGRVTNHGHADARAPRCEGGGALGAAGDAGTPVRVGNAEESSEVGRTPSSLCAPMVTK